jgi:molybdate transport system substrate-binding protein
MSSVLQIALVVLGISPITGFSPIAVRPGAPPPSMLTVYAAASLTDAFRELGRALEASHPGLTVQFNFAGSQQLALQIEQGAPADVFASADQRWMSFVAEKGLVAGESAIFARNRLVAIVPRTNPARIGGLPDLAPRGTKIVLAAEAVPAGKYSREALEKLSAAPGFPPEYARRVLANVVSQEENVKAVVAKVQLGEADAGLVYRSDVTPSVSRYVRVFEIEDPYNAIASYPIAVLKGA